MQEKPSRLIFLIVIIAATAGLLFGFDTGNIAGALIFIAQTFNTNIFENQLIVSITIFGAFLSAIFSGYFVENFGRRRMLMIAGGLFFSGAIIGAFSVSIITLMIGRLLLGLAIGISSYTAPLYISELAPAQYRGSLVLLNGIAITAGEAIAFLSDYWLSFGKHWRIMIGLGILPASILLLGTIWMPPSPRWLAIKGHMKKAKKILSYIRKTDITEEFSELLAIRKEAMVPYYQLITSKILRRPFFIGISLGIFQQFFGINAIMYYGPYIFKSAGFHTNQAEIFATFILGLVNFIATIFTSFYIDLYGRRKLLIAGSFIAGVSLLLIAYLFQQKTDYFITLIFFMIFYVIGYCISVGSLFWVITSEIYPLNVRSIAMSIVTSIQWLANLFISITFLFLMNYLGTELTFICFSLICFLCVVFSYAFITETKELSLEKIEKLYFGENFL